MSEGPYKLPEGWRWVRLEEILQDIQSGFAFGKKKITNGDLLHIRPFNIGIDGELNLAQKVYIPSTSIEKSLAQLESGDVLFNNTNSVELVGKTALVREPLCAAWSNHVTRLRADLSQCEPGWLAFSLRVLWIQGFFARNCNKWIGQAGFNIDAIKATEIPLPPLPEQRRIVARIEELMGRIREARRLREEARRDAECLWQAVLAETFPRPGAELPESWRWVRLGDVAKLFSGTWGDEITESRNPETVCAKVIRVSDIKESLTIDYDRAPLRAVKKREAERYRLTEGDLVVVKSSGSQAKVISGRAALFTVNTEHYIPSNFTFAVRPYQGVVSPVFLWYWLNSGYVRALIAKRVSTFTYPNLKKADYESVSVPLPPLPEQRRIVTHLEALQERIRALKEAQAQTEVELRRLEQAVLEKAFRGEL